MRKLGSPLYQELLEHAAADIERGGPVWDVVDAGVRPSKVLPGAQALRLLGAVHRLVLEGRAPGACGFLSVGRRKPEAGSARRRFQRPGRAAAREGLS